MICDFLASRRQPRAKLQSLLRTGRSGITLVCLAKRILTVFGLHVDEHPSRCRLAPPCQSTETYGFIGAPFVSLIELLCLFSQLRSCRLARICENAAVSAECGINDENPTGGMLKITALRRRHRTACMGHDLLNRAAESHLILTHHFRTPHHEHHWSSPLEMDTPASRADRRCSGSMGFAAVGRLLRSAATTSSRSGMIAPSTLNPRGSYPGEMVIGTRRISRRRAISVGEVQVRTPRSASSSRSCSPMSAVP